MRMDRAIRKTLIERYLEAATTTDEEKLLRDWFATHPAEEDEREIALLLGMHAPLWHSLPEMDEAVEEFDRVVEESERVQRRKIFRWTAMLGAAVAASVALFLWIVPMHTSSNSQLTPVQIAEGIQQMMLLDIGEIESIVATPADSYAILTASLKNGNTCSYILRCNGEDGTTTLFAYQTTPNQ